MFGEWPNDAKIGPRLARRTVDSIRSPAANKGYDPVAFRKQLRENAVRPLIKHRLYQPIDHAHNARLNEDRYNKRALVESVNSSINRSIRETIDARYWFRQFHELALVASVYNINRAIQH